jgi:hypothetical protein
VKNQPLGLAFEAVLSAFLIMELKGTSAFGAIFSFLGFRTSRLLFCCPLAMAALLQKLQTRLLDEAFSIAGRLNNKNQNRVRTESVIWNEIGGSRTSDAAKSQALAKRRFAIVGRHLRLNCGS